MARDIKGAKSIEPAWARLDGGVDVVGLPEMAAAIESELDQVVPEPSPPLVPVVAERRIGPGSPAPRPAGPSMELLQDSGEPPAISLAERTHPVVSGPNGPAGDRLIATDHEFVHAPLGAPGDSALRDLDAAPAAKAPAVGPAGGGLTRRGIEGGALEPTGIGAARGGAATPPAHPAERCSLGTVSMKPSGAQRSSSLMG